jgi:hypothetical protein
MIQSSTEFIPDASIIEKNSDNYTPDASIMIKNLESSGKGLPENIQELIDNSIDANSTECHIHLRSSRGENTYFAGITIIDNGDGFASRDAFENGMKIGSADVEHKLNAIGKYTMGLKEGCFSLANSISICSKNKKGEMFYCFMDLELMKSRNSYTPTRVETISNIHNYKQSFPSNEDYDDFCRMRTGTQICLFKLKHEYDKGIEKQKEELEKSISLAYRYNTKIKIFVNNNIVDFVDIFYEKPENEIKLEYVNNLPLRVYIIENKLQVFMQMLIKMEIEKNNVQNPGWYCLKLSAVGEKGARNRSFLSDVMKEDELPRVKHYKLNARAICIKDDFFKKENEKMLFSNFSKRNGVCTIRGDTRYVSHFKTLKDVKFDDYFNRWRICVVYESNELDTYFGINRSKQQGSTMLSDDIPKMEKVLWELTAKPYVKAKKTEALSKKTPVKVEPPVKPKNTPVVKVEPPVKPKNTHVVKVEAPVKPKNTHVTKIPTKQITKEDYSDYTPPSTSSSSSSSTESKTQPITKSFLSKTPAFLQAEAPVTKIPTKQIIKEDSDYTPPSTSSSTESKTQPSRMPTFLQVEAHVIPKQNAKIKIDEENTLLKFKLSEFETKYNNLLEERNEFETKYNNLLEEKKEWNEKEEKLLDKITRAAFLRPT